MHKPDRPTLTREQIDQLVQQDIRREQFLCIPLVLVCIAAVVVAAVLMFGR